MNEIRPAAEIWMSSNTRVAAAGMIVVIEVAHAILVHAELDSLMVAQAGEGGIRAEASTMLATLIILDMAAFAGILIARLIPVAVTTAADLVAAALAIDFLT